MIHLEAHDRFTTLSVETYMNAVHVYMYRQAFTDFHYSTLKVKPESKGESRGSVQGMTPLPE